MEARITQFFERYIRNAYFPEMHLTDIVEILIIAFLVYQIMIWIKNTKAWMLLKGILVLGVFIFVAFLFQMHTILWIASNSLTVLATALIVVFQPELRRALEKLGERKYISAVMPFDSTKTVSARRRSMGSWMPPMLWEGQRQEPSLSWSRPSS